MKFGIVISHPFRNYDRPREAKLPKIHNDIINNHNDLLTSNITHANVDRVTSLLSRLSVGKLVGRLVGRSASRSVGISYIGREVTHACSFRVTFFLCSPADVVGACPAGLRLHRGLGHPHLLRRGPPGLTQLLGEGEA